MTREEHQAKLDEIIAAATDTRMKPVQTDSLLKRYIRQHGLPAAVARFADGTVQIVWKES